MQPHGHAPRVCILRHAFERKEAAAAHIRCLDLFIPVPAIRAACASIILTSNSFIRCLRQGWTFAFCSHRLLQHAAVDGHLSQALAGCGKDRVGHCGNDDRSPGFAHSTRRLGTLDNVDLDGRRLVHAQHLISVEIGLLDTAVLQCDLAIERRRDAEDDRALNLRPDGIGVDDGAAIDCADDPADANRAILRHFDLGNLCAI